MVIAAFFFTAVLPVAMPGFAVAWGVSTPIRLSVLAQRLVAFESGADEGAGQAGLVALRVCDKLREPLCTLAGPGACRILMSRALALARTKAPSLGNAEIGEDGSLVYPASGLEAGAGPNAESGLLLITHLLGLLLGLIGEAAMLRLIAQAIIPNLNPGIGDFVPVGFEAILNEAEQLHEVSGRLAGLADRNPPVAGELLTVAGSLAGTANLLSVLVAVKSPRPN